MFTQKKIPRVLAVFLCMALIFTSLTACFKETLSYEPNESDSLAPYEEEASVASKGDEEPSDEPSPPAESEIFSAGVGQVLINAVRQNDSITSAQFDILLNPGKESPGAANTTNTTLHMVQVGEDDQDTTYSVEQINNSETGDASLAIDIQSGSDSSSRCGLFFYENMMLVKKVNVEKPMILHSLNTQVSESYISLSAFERYSRVLNDTNAPKLSDEEWTAAIDAYLAQVSDIAKDPDYSASEEPGTYAGIEMSCTVSTLKLMGERALTVVRSLVVLIEQDTILESLFNSLYRIGEDEYGVTGLDGVLRDIDALDDATRKAAILTFKLVEADVPIGIYVTLTAGDKTFQLNLAFVEDGYIRHNDITFEGFDGSIVVMQDSNVSDGADTYTEEFLFTVSGPGGETQENMTATVQSTVTQSNYDSETQFAYTRAATEGMDAVSLSGAINYSQVKGDDGINSSAYGTLELSEEEQTNTYNIDMTSVQTDGTIPVTPPEFYSASGISTADQQGLYEALGDFDGAAFALSPMTTQMLAGLMLLLL